MIDLLNSPLSVKSATLLYFGVQIGKRLGHFLKWKYYDWKFARTYEEELSSSTIHECRTEPYQKGKDVSGFCDSQDCKCISYAAASRGLRFSDKTETP